MLLLNAALPTNLMGKPERGVLGTGELSQLLQATRLAVPPFHHTTNENPVSPNKYSGLDFRRQLEDSSYSSDYAKLRQLLLSDRRVLPLVMNSMGPNWERPAQQARLKSMLDAPAGNDQDRAEYEFLRDLRDFIALAKSTFLTTPTLEDELEPIDANRLFKLGRLLVLLSWPEMRSELDKLTTGKPK
jgi:hypothetical protein